MTFKINPKAPPEGRFLYTVAGGAGIWEGRYYQASDSGAYIKVDESGEWIESGKLFVVELLDKPKPPPPPPVLEIHGNGKGKLPPLPVPKKK